MNRDFIGDIEGERTTANGYKPEPISPSESFHAAAEEGVAGGVVLDFADAGDQIDEWGG